MTAATAQSSISFWRKIFARMAQNSVIPIYLKSQRASVSAVTGSTYLEQLDEALLKRRSAPTAAVIDIRVSPSAISLVIARSHSKLSKHWSGTSDLFLWCEV